MLKESGFVKSNKKIVLTALLINIATVLVCILFFSPAFETNDDSGLIAIASGMRGARDPHLVHSNYLLGKLMTGLYAMFPELQWWSLLQFALLFTAFFMLTLIFIRDDFSITRIILITAVLFFFSYEGYVRIQYTKTAGILSAAGLMVLFYGLIRKKADWALITIGIILAIFGSFYRIQEFLSITAVFSSMVVFLVLYHIRESDEPVKRIASALAVGIILLLVTGGFRIYDRNQYKDKAWSEYLEFDKYRTEVIDYGVPDYEEHREEYNAIGIDDTAYKLMRQWTFQDNEKFTADTFRQIAGFKEKKTVNIAFLKRFIRKFAKGFLHEGTSLCLLIISLGWLIAGRRSVRNWISLAVMAAVILTLNFYLYYAGRFMVHRVDVGIWFAASLIVLYQLLPDKEASDTEAEGGTGGMIATAFCSAVPLILALMIALVFAIRVPWQESLKNESAERSALLQSERESAEEIGGDKEHLYLTKVGTLQFSEAYGVFDPVPYKIADNIYPLGGWGAATPLYTDVLRRYNVDNPFRDMIGNDNIYLVDKDIDTTIAYLRKWYKADATAELVKTINSHKIYRVY